MMLKNASNQSGTKSVTVAPWHKKSRPRMLVDSKAAFLENYLAVSRMFNRSLIECHEKKHQPFNLSGVRFGRRFKFLGENLLGTGAIENELSTLGPFSQCVVIVNTKPTKSLKFSILSPKSFATSKQLK